MKYTNMRRGLIVGLLLPIMLITNVAHWAQVVFVLTQSLMYRVPFSLKN